MVEQPRGGGAACPTRLVEEQMCQPCDGDKGPGPFPATVPGDGVGGGGVAVLVRSSAGCIGHVGVLGVTTLVQDSTVVCGSPFGQTKDFYKASLNIWTFQRVMNRLIRY